MSLTTLDHVELRALTDPDRNSSAAELTSELKVTGSSDAVLTMKNLLKP